MELYDVMRTTAAIREFTGEPLPDDVLARILDHARFAPSGGNRQGAHLVLVTDPETRAALAELNGYAVRRYVAQKAAGESPWNPLHPAGPSAEEIAATEVPANFTNPVLTAAVVVVVCVDLGVVAAMDQELDRIGVVSGASVYPLVWNVLMAARNEGFGGTITTMAAAGEPAGPGAARHPGDVRRRGGGAAGQAGQAADEAAAPAGGGVRDLRAVRRAAVRLVMDTRRCCGCSRTSPRR